MDKYSRLLVHLSTVNGNKKDENLYPSFIKDLSVLESPSEELSNIMKDDLPTLLPAILILSLHEDVSIRTAIARTFDTFCFILNKNPSVKSMPWWKDMETKLIAERFSIKLVKMVEMNDEPWANIWAFVTRLIVHDEYVQGSSLNSLLKVVETAFKMSKKNDAIMQKAYYCWNQLIDIFSKHPRVICSQKLVELLVRPLSTTHLSLKCPDLKIETWCHLMRKIGFSCGNKCKFVIEPFIDFMYLKGEDSLCKNYPIKCIEAFTEMIQEKKTYKYYALKVMSAFIACYENCSSEDMEPFIIKIWTGILDNIPDVDKNNRYEYILEIFTRLYQALQIEKPKLNHQLMKIFVEKEVFNTDNLKTIIMSELSLISIFSEFMKFNDFRNISFALVVKDMTENFSEANSKKLQNNIELQIWDLLSEVYAMWLKNLSSSQESDSIDNESLCSLLMIPFLYKQWSVAVQKTWYSVVDSVHSTEAANKFLPHLLDKINDALKESHVNAALCIEICTHLVNKDKGAYKMIMPTLNAVSNYLPSKDSKPLLDLLVLLENAVSRVPKNDLTKLVNELMVYGNKYEHPYGLRIKTKISKVQRKLFTLKDNETSKEQENSHHNKTNENNEPPNGCKSRSPILAQSSFLQRLAKAEEKKKKKVPSMASIFGESLVVNQSNLACSPEIVDKNEEVKSPPASPEKLEKKNEEVTEKKNIVETTVMNGRCSPVLPNIVNIVTPSKLKRSQTKSPEPIPLSNEAVKPASIKMPPPPTYFEDNAQDFVIVAPKVKITPLTEHQKEMLSKRRSDIPALYQDLSQDTQTDSQSLKEIIMLKGKINEVGGTKQVEISKESTDILKDKKEGIDNKSEGNSSNKVSLLEKLNKNISDLDEESNELKKSKASDITVQMNKINTSESSAPCDLEISMKLQVTESFAEVNESFEGFKDVDLNFKNNFKTKDEINSVNLEHKPDFKTLDPLSDKLEDSSEEIIENTPQFEPAVSLNLTPTKQPGPPTPRNLIRRLNLLEEDENTDVSKTKFIEEEEETEKENMIINSKQNAEKTPTTTAKRRSLRKSSGIFSTRNPDEIKEGKVKSKKEFADALKEVSEECDAKESKLSTTDMSSATDGLKPVLDEINNKKETTSVAQPVVVSLNSSESLMNKPLKISDKNIESEAVVSLNGEKVPGKTESNEIKSFSERGVITTKLDGKLSPTQDNKSADDKTSNEEGKAKGALKEEELNTKRDTIVQQNLENTNCVENSQINMDSDSINTTTSPKNSDKSLLEQSDADDNTENTSGDVSNWALTTPQKSGRKKKNPVKTLSPRFSPKLLRSKRLSLTKSQVTPDQSVKKIRKYSSLTKGNIENKKNNSEKAVTVAKSVSITSHEVSEVESNDEVSTADKNVDHSSSPSGSITSDTDANAIKNNRKRKSNENNIEVEGKKKKTDVSIEDINQDSLLVVKNNMVKPRKKKIIKSNVKNSPNNLEQWLIKSGKTVVKTSLISQELNETESKTTDDIADLQGNSSNSSKDIVEMSPKKGLNSTNPDIIVIAASPEGSEDIHNCTLMNESSLNLNISSSSEDEPIREANASPNEIPVEMLQCHETELSISTPETSDENAVRRSRRKRRLLKREETPLREGIPSSEDETFDAKKERLTTPFKPSLNKSGRSAQMVMMATGDDEQEQPHTPRRRRSISVLRLTDNWPEGRLEEWVPCMPTPPGVPNPSPGILRRRPILSPASSPTSSSPSLRRKRVSFLDPPVSKGLLYCKGETLGQIQHADIPPGETPVWKDEEEVSEQPGPSGLNSSKDSSVDGGFGSAEGEDDLTAIQEFLNNTPDAPWSKTAPLELRIKNIAGLESCTEPVEKLLSKLADGEEERSLLQVEIKKLNVSTVLEFCSIELMELNRLSNTFPKIKSLATIIQEYIKEKTSHAGSSEPPLVSEPMAVEQILPSHSSSEENEKTTEAEEKCLKIEEVKTLDFTNQSVQTEAISSAEIPIDDLVELIPSLLSDKEFLERIADKIPRLLEENTPFINCLASHADYSFLARLCLAIESQRKKPG